MTSTVRGFLPAVVAVRRAGTILKNTNLKLSTFDRLCFLVLPRGGAQPHDDALKRSVHEKLHTGITAARLFSRLGEQDASKNGACMKCAGCLALEHDVRRGFGDES